MRILLVVAAFLLLGGAALSAQPATYVFTADGAMVGIPDGGAGTPPQYGPPAIYTVNVSGVPAPATRVVVGVLIAHAWIGDVQALVKAPDNTTLELFERPGAPPGSGFGAELAGLYLFADNGGRDLWAEAAGSGGSELPASVPGDYSTYFKPTGPGGVARSLDSTFGGLATSAINGVWSVEVRDAEQGIDGGIGGIVVGLAIAPSAIIQYGPTSGSSAGNTLVTIDGYGFVPDETEVRFGPILGEVVSVTDEEIKVRTPPTPGGVREH
jgi:hypothetical protein